MSKDEKEIDIYIKYKLSKYKQVPESIDNLFNNFIKEEEKMENNNQESVSQNETKTKKSKLKKIIGIAACIMVLFLGANIYATTKGYDNIFFLIKHIVNGGSITDKNEILSDRDITISYKSIEVGKGIKIQINKLTVKDNEAKLYLVVDNQKATEEIKNMTFNVTSSDNTQMCNETIENEEQTDYLSSKFEKELKLNNLKEDTKILYLNITANDLPLSTLIINLETREIEVDGEKELEKISEIELKQYLSAFALLTYDAAGEHNSYESNNERKLLAATALANNSEYYNNHETNRSIAGPNFYDIEDTNKLVQSFTDVPIEEGVIKLENWFFKLDTKNEIQYYTYTKIDGEPVVPTAICLSVDEITYENGIYNIKFTYCYPSNDDYANDNIENIERYTNTIKLKLNTDSEYSKYFVEEIGAGELIKSSTKKEEENNTDTNSNQNNEQSNTVSTPTSTTNTSNIDNYTTSMNWGTYRSAGLIVTYPTDFTITETTNPNKGNSSGELYATISGTAIGKQDGQVTNTDMSIYCYEPEVYTKEQIEWLENKTLAGDITSYNTGIKWYRIDKSVDADGQRSHETYVARVGLNYEDGSDTVVKVSFEYTPATYKAINIMNYMLGELRFASY